MNGCRVRRSCTGLARLSTARTSVSWILTMSCSPRATQTLSALHGRTAPCRPWCTTTAPPSPGTLPLLNSRTSSGGEAGAMLVVTADGRETRMARTRGRRRRSVRYAARLLGTCVRGCRAVTSFMTSVSKSGCLKPAPVPHAATRYRRKVKHLALCVCADSLELPLFARLE